MATFPNLAATFSGSVHLRYRRMTSLCIVSKLFAKEDAHSTHLETRMSYLFRRWIRSCSAPAFENFFLSSAIGRAIESNVWPCERALVRPRAFAYVFSFVFLKIQLNDALKEGKEDETNPKP